MPTLQLLSDLHFEHERDWGADFISSLEPSGVDVLVLAGDITIWKMDWSSRAALGKICDRYSDAMVLYIAGNHEFYGTTRTQVLDSIEDFSNDRDNFFFLDNAFCTVGSQRFFGATMWFKDTGGPLSVKKRAMTDFNVIKDFESWVYKENEKTVRMLNDVREGDIVITHHLPSNQCVAPQYRGSSLNSWFVCDVDDKILEKKPKYHLFGHTHVACDMMLGDTRLVCNPRGYPGEGGTNFNPKLLLDF